MKIILFMALLLTTAHAQTNTLILTWTQPPNFSSTLYESTNLTDWHEMGHYSPPCIITTTNPTAFFFVQCGPTNQANPIVGYDLEPNAEGVIPPYPNLPALAYPTNNNYCPLYYWNIKYQDWE